MKHNDHSTLAPLSRQSGTSIGNISGGFAFSIFGFCVFMFLKRIWTRHNVPGYLHNISRRSFSVDGAHQTSQIPTLTVAQVPRSSGSCNLSNENYNIIDAIENLPSFPAFGDMRNLTCAICLELLITENVSSGQCLHFFHSTCLKNWLVKDKKRACPICRVHFLGTNYQVN